MRTILQKLRFIFLLAMPLCFSMFAIEIKITQGMVQPITFQFSCNDEEMQRKVTQNLVSNGMFIEDFASTSRLIVKCSVNENSCHVIASFDGQIFNKTFSKNAFDLISNYLHQIAWNIPGDFTSKLLVIHRGGQKKASKNKDNVLILYDRNGEKPVILDKAPIISTPNVSRDGTKIAYVKHINHFACIFLYDLQTNKSIQLTPSTHIFSSPMFEENNSIICAGSRNGSTSLYRINLKTQQISSLTHADKWIDTCPTATAKKDHLIIISDMKNRNKPEICVLDLSGSKAAYRQISNLKGSYNDPACAINPFSPSITHVAFFKRANNMAYLGLMMLDNELNLMQERLLWQSKLVFAPSWSYDGITLFFSTGEQIKRINIYTGKVQTIIDQKQTSVYGAPKSAVVVYTQ